MKVPPSFYNLEIGPVAVKGGIEREEKNMGSPKLGSCLDMTNLEMNWREHLLVGFKGILGQVG